MSCGNIQFEIYLKAVLCNLPITYPSTSYYKRRKRCLGVSYHIQKQNRTAQSYRNTQSSSFGPPRSYPRLTILSQLLSYLFVHSLTAAQSISVFSASLSRPNTLSTNSTPLSLPISSTLPVRSSTLRPSLLAARYIHASQASSIPSKRVHSLSEATRKSSTNFTSSARAFRPAALTIQRSPLWHRPASPIKLNHNSAAISANTLCAVYVYTVQS